jgi:hypothetical protein
MAFVKDVLVEEYIRLSEKLEFYSNKSQDTYLKTIVEIKKDMDFIEKAFVANNIDLAQEVVKMQIYECEYVRGRKKQGRENTESAETKNESKNGYRGEMKKASQDLHFMQDCKDVMEHFSQADEEVFAKPETDRRDSRKSTLDERKDQRFSDEKNPRQAD